MKTTGRQGKMELLHWPDGSRVTILPPDEQAEVNEWEQVGLREDQWRGLAGIPRVN